MDNQSWSRRIFLKVASLGMVAFGVGGPPRFLGRLVSAADAQSIQSRRKTLVTIFQRGAMDGIMAVPPLGDEGLKRLRPRLAMSERARDDNRLLDLGDGFGLHPALEPFLPLFEERRPCPHWAMGCYRLPARGRSP